MKNYVDEKLQKKVKSFSSFSPQTLQKIFQE